MIKDDRPYTNIYNLTIWPAGFLLYLQVRQLYGLIIYFTNKDGTINITSTDDKIAAGGDDEVEGKKSHFTVSLFANSTSVLMLFINIK